MTVVDVQHLEDVCRQAIIKAGSNQSSAEVLARATVEAERVGNRAVGVGHLFDYLEGYRRGRIASETKPTIDRPSPAIFDVDAKQGIAQEAFMAVGMELSQAARQFGISALWIRNSFTCGELGYYSRRMADLGMVGVAMANSPALMSLGGSPSRVVGTNPLAFALPRADRWPLVIDQASSATAFVNIRHAAEEGEEIPEGWALDAEGSPTQDASDALQGTLLPFGSHRGGNIALLVEMLATLSGAAFSIDAAPFDSGEQSPNIGVFLLCVDPENFLGSVDRLWAHVQRLHEAHQVRIPAVVREDPPAQVEIEDSLLEALYEAAVG